MFDPWILQLKRKKRHSLSGYVLARNLTHLSCRKALEAPVVTRKSSVAMRVYNPLHPAVDRVQGISHADLAQLPPRMSHQYNRLRNHLM